MTTTAPEPAEFIAHLEAAITIVANTPPLAAGPATTWSGWRISGDTTSTAAANVRRG